jgi:hypothetical protein
LQFKDQLTVIVVELLTPPELAVMTVVPGVAVVARPAILGALAIVATLATDELQCAIIVMSCVPARRVPIQFVQLGKGAPIYSAN